MRRIVQGVTALGLDLALVGSAMADGPFVYPQRGQSPEQHQQQAAGSAYDRAFAACMDGRGYTVR